METLFWKDKPKPSTITLQTDRTQGLATGLFGQKEYANLTRYTNNTALKKEEMVVKKTEEEIMMQEVAKLNSLSIKCQKFKTILEQPNIDFEALRKLSWNGIPDEIRPTVWKLLMGYLPANNDRRESTLQRKRKEYDEFVLQNFSRGATLDQQLSHQVGLMTIRCWSD